MNRAVQTPVQGRDAAGTAEEVEVVGIPWKPRTDGAQALLLTERRTVFDHKAAVIEPMIEAGALGPVPTEWTADLVHCRLLSVDALARRLPRVRVPAQYVSFLGAMQPQDAAGGSTKGLSAEEEQRIDWTLARIFAFGSIDRAVLMGMMAGQKPETISKVTFGIAVREGGQGLKRPSVYKRYQRDTKIIADAWNLLGVPIDDGTRDVWMNYAAQKRN